ncbi:Transcriptional regulatory protein QseB [Burkholderia cepacia]|nr:Transcriptional regulatory protein QseB [Burkholderia cepacia]
MRIAVLDDDPAQTDFVSQTLTAVGHTCYAFKEGKALKKRLQRETFDLLVLDWNVPDMSGEEVLKWVRANQTEHSLPIIFMTSRDDEAGITQILNAGATITWSSPCRAPSCVRASARCCAARIRSTPRQPFASSINSVST